MKKILLFLTFFGMLISTCIISAETTTAFKTEKIKYPRGIRSVTSVTEVFGTGQQITHIILEFNEKVVNSQLTKNTFTVSDRTVEKIYSNTRPEKTDIVKDGRFVIIELNPKDSGASLRLEGNDEVGFQMKKATSKVTQKEDILFTNGKKLEKSIAILENNKIKNLIVENFKQFVYKDPKTGTTVKYNLYIPKNYDKNKKYPLVLFMHDAGVLSEDTKTTLLQGNGAISFATPEEQERHEAFVLAPQYSRKVVDDNGDITSDLDATVNLIKDYLISKYSIDEKKLYATGQSMGGMMAIVMNYKYPELFAASYLVACQWDPKEVSTMARNNLWITVSTGDAKAYPGMNAITSELIKRGATVAKDSWRADYTDAQFLEGARKVIAQKSNIKYITLEKGTNPYLPKDANPGLEHSGTWKVAYSIPGIKDWMFLQSKQ
ncbi:alpha/beta hydrolase-fold protein [Leptotrichia wadei]|uniref:Putative phage head-tail adaptor n=1 Tax=Leptotrichia wadei (strain F0279) TaxID=888055 RepID=U2RAZ2_LEPWF|nr:alpha/beta hydrolase-fold protein [Leptotrichia wadei]ERK47892.1 putative phage head-tail adaptor [Leptotrichia wadei F0279]